MSEIKLPGILYSLLLAVGAWAIDYFATGNAGGNYIWAPILLATVPVILKMFTVATGDDGPAAAARGVGDAVQPRSKISKVLFG